MNGGARAGAAPGRGAEATGERVRVVVAGAGGRTGAVVTAALRRCGDVELVATIGRGDEARAVLAECRAQVLVDFTLAAVSAELAPLAAAGRVAPVIGTSGLAARDVQRIATACREAGVAGLLVPNFSLGAVLQMRFAEQAARWLACEIVDEVHHPAKRDSPSGTARATAVRIARAAAGGGPAGSPAVCGVSGAAGAAEAAAATDAAGGTDGGAAAVTIASERREGAVATQRVRFAGPGESLELRHAVSDRTAFVPGVLLAVRRVRTLPAGLHVGLEHVLEPTGRERSRPA